MTDKRVYLLAQFDEHTSKTLAGLYGRLAKAGLTGGQTKEIPYHFTMADFDMQAQAQALHRAQATAQKTSAFAVHLTHIGLFGLNVLFLAPSPNPDLLALYENLTPPAPPADRHPWVAHATLLIDTPDNIRTAIPLIAQSFKPFTARIESIGAYAFFPKKHLAAYNLLPPSAPSEK